MTTGDGGGVLAVVATPIGNLEDITLRALRVLRECDAVVAEDSRRTRALLSAHGISARTVSLPAFDEMRRVPALLERLDRGETLALCTDAGTPVVSDPGAALVRAARQRGHRVVSVPGPSAVVAALAASGLAGSGFSFLGFLPRTPSKLVRVLEAALALGNTVAFYESPLRLARTLRIAAPLLGDREVVIARELTKVHEEYHSGTAGELAVALAARPPRGECTVLVAA
ncbi:MAG: 16S rRNA (cytidine(1402)-2'-O)-methyltransferase [Candidatus Dormibacteraeota bacterium]|nr:16S rRNA (cytidine(1402)-2'-O)-methyltransferase [Candidatus Dormibacteraeota bacterium]MBV9526342.1 16S rRNA (cytidine(1402)-2'-O)-methyltransferase [Candidatus Dormibacteraeota bacterium]